MCSLHLALVGSRCRSNGQPSGCGVSPVRAHGTQLAVPSLTPRRRCKLSDDVLVWRGHRVRVVQAGAGDPLLLISGLGSHLEMWAPFAAEFRERRIIRFDM